MIVARDYRRGEVNIKMGLDEFRETVEWLEMIDPRDAATKDWRKALNRIDPVMDEE